MIPFVTLTFLISGSALGLAALLFGENALENPAAIPFALVTVWGPNIAAFLLAWRERTLPELWRPLLRRAPAGVWLGAALPLGVTAIVALLHWPVQWDAIGFPLLAGMLLFQLILGPLGEELGWRGWMLPRLIPRYGAVSAALIVGIVWAFWHAPLWFVASPQSEIPFPLFATTVVCFSMVMTVLYVAGRGALGPMVLFHLFVNFGLGWLAAAGVESDAAFRHGLPVYLCLAASSAWWLSRRRRE